MGNLPCCPRENGDAYDDVSSERRPLLGGDAGARGDTTTGSPGGVKAIIGSGGGIDTREKKSDEQTALNRILQNTADQVIDVGALDTRSLEQRDYLDRARQYNARLALSVKPPPELTHPTNPVTRLCLPPGFSPLAVLAAPAPSARDFQFLSELTGRCVVGIDEIAVTHVEELVVPFGAA